MNFSDSNLIFLISQPRSGSTLLQAILAGHDDIFSCSEPWIALFPFSFLKEAGVEYAFNRKMASNALRHFLIDCNLSQKDIYEEFGNSLLNIYKKAILKTNKKFFLDKTPRYYEILDELSYVFNNSKFIILHRNPIDVINSIFDTWVKNNLQSIFLYTRDIIEAPKKILDFERKKINNIMIIKYEELVIRPEKELKKICDFIEINFDKDIIRYKNYNWGFGDKNYKDKILPDKKSINSWKNEKDNRTKINFMSYYLDFLGKKTFEDYGYDYDQCYKMINKLKPNNNDKDLWDFMVSNYKIYKIDEIASTFSQLIKKQNLKNANNKN